MLEDQRCFVLLQIRFLFGVIEEVTLRHQLSHDVPMRLSLKLMQKFNDVRMSTLSQDTTLPLYHLLLSVGKLEVLDHFDRHIMISAFVPAFEHLREIATTDALEFYILIKYSTFSEF